MKKICFNTLIPVLLLLIGTGIHLQAQSTYSEVYNILQSNCLGCHEGANPQGNLDFSGTQNEVYDLLIEQAPTNPFAQSMDYKLVDQGYPDRSTLYRKVNDGLYHSSEMEPGEGNVMPPNNLPTLADADKELIRQWIFFGAPKSGKVINKATLETYYNDGGIPHLERPEPPAAGEGFQLYLGSIFLKPNEEREYIYKYELKNPEPIEIHKLDVAMSTNSHHFLFFKFDPGADADEDEGLEEVTVLSSITGEAIAITSDTEMIGGWAYSGAYDLPKGTAYIWPENTVLKFNYHIKNYSQTEVAPIDLYVNVYTQESGTALHEMRSDFQLYDPFLLSIPPGEKSFTWNLTNFAYANNNDSVHLWVVGAHTHQYGTDFDIYLRNPGGGKGEQIYEGYFNFDYSFNQGYYDYAEPPMRVFDEMISIKEKDGLYITADYNNTTNNTVNFGLTTKDEMFGVFLQYLVGDISDLPDNELLGINDNSTGEDLKWNVYPNPFSGQTNIVYQQKDNQSVLLKVFNLLGQELINLSNDIPQTAGTHQVVLDAKKQGLQNGMYIVQLQVGDVVHSKRITILKQ